MSDLNKDTNFYNILNEYLTHFTNRINIVKERVMDISSKIKSHSKEFELGNLSKEDINIVKKLQNEFVDLGTEKEKLNINIRIITEFNVDLALDNIKRNDPMFEKLMNHFLDTEKFEYCKQLTDTLNKHFDDEEGDNEKPMAK